MRFLLTRSLVASLGLILALPVASTAAPRCTIQGTAGDHVIRGTGRGDIICAGDGDDFVRGGPGNDMVRAGDGLDVVHGERGDDRISGGRRRDTLFGDEGNDVIRGQRGGDNLWGFLGNDRIIGEREGPSLRWPRRGQAPWRAWLRCRQRRSGQRLHRRRAAGRPIDRLGRRRHDQRHRRDRGERSAVGEQRDGHLYGGPWRLDHQLWVVHRGGDAAATDEPYPWRGRS